MSEKRLTVCDVCGAESLAARSSCVPVALKVEDIAGIVEFRFSGDVCQKCRIRLVHDLECWELEALP